MATAQRARHVHVDPDCVCAFSVMDLVTVSLSHTVTFYRGSPPRAVLRLDVAGLDLTENVVKFATEQECPFSTTAEGDTARDVKERNCAAVVWITTLSPGVRRKLKEKTHGHPDGNIIVGAECFHHCVEKLFQPSFIGKEANGFHEKSTKCDTDIRESLRSCHVARWLDHVPIFERMTKELTALASSRMKIKVGAPPERMLSCGLEDPSCLHPARPAEFVLLPSSVVMAKEVERFWLHPRWIFLSHCGRRIALPSCLAALSSVFASKN